MEKMIASEMQTYVERLFKRTDKSAEIMDALSDTVINMRLHYPFDDFKQEAYTASLVTLGNYKLDLPSDLGHLIGDVRIIDGNQSRPLVKITKAQFDRRFPNPNDSDVTKAKPYYYCVYGTQILLGSVPDSIDYQYEINYSEEGYILFSATDTATYVPFTDKFRKTLRYGILADLYVGLDNDTLAQKYFVLYEKGLQAMAKRDEDNTDAPSFVAYNDC